MRQHQVQQRQSDAERRPHLNAINERALRSNTLRPIRCISPSAQQKPQLEPMIDQSPDVAGVEPHQRPSDTRERESDRMEYRSRGLIGFV
jgi:hypothetical protein